LSTHAQKAMDGKLKPLNVDVQVGGYTLMVEV